MSGHQDFAIEPLREQLQTLSWPERFDRLALEHKRAQSDGDREAVAALRSECADRALAELRPGWGSVPLKQAILTLPSKKMRGALGQAAKRARDRAIVDLVTRGGSPYDGRFGQGMDERVLEIPLALRTARLHEPGEVLDAGFALNVPVVREVAGRPVARVTHFTLAGSTEPILSGDEDRYQRVFGDLRAMPYADGSFDRAVCVSTLEHVGMDNGRYGALQDASHEQSPETAHLAVSELIRVLSPGGELLITVPYGHQADHGWFRVLDQRDLCALLASASSHTVDTRFFYYESGWAEGGPEPPASVLNAGFAADVVTGVAVVHVTKAKGAPD
jgi:SAM-dependent methyltransferase